MRPFVQDRKDFSEAAWRQFAKSLHFVSGDFSAPASETYATLRRQIKQVQRADHIPDNVLIHLAVPPQALVQLNGDIFLFYNKSLGDLNVEKFTHQHTRRVDGVDDVGHAYPHSSRHLCDVEIARKLDWRLYKRLF